MAGLWKVGVCGTQELEAAKARLRGGNGHIRQDARPLRGRIEQLDATFENETAEA